MIVDERIGDVRAKRLVEATSLVRHWAAAMPFTEKGRAVASDAEGSRKKCLIGRNAPFVVHKAETLAIDAAKNRGARRTTQRR